MPLEKRDQIARELARKTSEVEAFDLKLRHFEIAREIAVENGSAEALKVETWLDRLSRGEGAERLKAEIMRKAYERLLAEMPVPKVEEVIEPIIEPVVDEVII